MDFWTFFDFWGLAKIFGFLVKTGTGGTGTGGRRNRPEPNRTVGFLTFEKNYLWPPFGKMTNGPPLICMTELSQVTRRSTGSTMKEQS